MVLYRTVGGVRFSINVSSAAPYFILFLLEIETGASLKQINLFGVATNLLV